MRRQGLTPDPGLGRDRSDVRLHDKQKSLPVPVTRRHSYLNAALFRWSVVDSLPATSTEFRRNTHAIRDIRGDHDVLWIFCIVDAITREDPYIQHLSKVVWIVIIIFVPTLGSILWLIVGRGQNAQRTVTGSPSYGGCGRPGRAIAQDPADDKRSCDSAANAPKSSAASASSRVRRGKGRSGREVEGETGAAVHPAA